MSMIKKLVKTLYVLICAVLIVQLAGCGTMMYPERRGQKGGRIDPGVAVMDGLCLLLFIIPGVIAFFVDFSNGTIYLPHTSTGSLDAKNIKMVKFDPKNYTQASIEKIIYEETGAAVNLDQANVKISRLTSMNDMAIRLAEVLPKGKNNRMALNVEYGIKGARPKTSRST
jgi:uncharacterized lipoprotein YehR (DUF1307 family)